VSFREIVGLVLSCIAVALVPVGLYASRSLWLLAALLAAIGVTLFYTERVERKERELERQPSNEPVRESVPADIHNYSGWRSGGRRNEIESESSRGEVAAD
jgi:hypothetical protein